MREPAPIKFGHVVFDSGIQDYLQNGWYLEVVCLDAFVKNSYWYGQWVMLFVAPDDGREIPLVSIRSSKSSDMRLFKSANAVMSFLYQNGITAPIIPLRISDRKRQICDSTPAALPSESQVG